MKKILKNEFKIEFEHRKLKLGEKKRNVDLKNETEEIIKYRSERTTRRGRHQSRFGGKTRNVQIQRWKKKFKQKNVKKKKKIELK